MSAKARILVICIHNSSRSQMAEEYLRLFGGDLFEVESAGLEPGNLNPVVVELLKDDGIEIEGKATRSVFDLHRQGRAYDYVIAVCDPEAKERCPIFPAEKQRLHWPFPDPSAVKGSFEQRLVAVRPIQQEIRDKVLDFVQEYRDSQS
ncbi:arsenate reductase ArsC [Spirochaeta africana]|uniref:Protein-tyrosine-phosphatase n=1 Tax=Spirochaeta africana (strain ATCC 700263 / DSM 8902 / Z-7692) TaxID=889378 RepID=H9UJY3_SPIAZ|nr:arsenate reductase ArsC [Spirochaeta africana]AFG37826.1 protein-tyrosine-phosphatase [Spirochaeta africana DSM 8902]